jgi:UDP-glucose 4-epimerase
MRVLITGGAGFIGRHLVQRLVGNPRHEVVVLDNLHRAERPDAKGFTWIQGDVRDREAVAAAMRGSDVVFHLAAESNVIGALRDLDYSFSTNVVGTYNVLSAARAAGVGKVVFTSSREVYGEPARLPVAETARLEPKNAYGASKLAGEECCRAYAREILQVTTLRLTNVYGPGDAGRVIPEFVRNALWNEPLVLYGGEQVLDFVWIDCVTDALLGAMDLDSSVGPVNIGSGIGTTVRALAELILRQIPSAGGIIREEPRNVEVRSFVADVRKAISRGMINQPGGSPEYLGRVVEFERCRLHSAAAGFEQAALKAEALGIMSC